MPKLVIVELTFNASLKYFTPSALKSFPAYNYKYQKYSSVVVAFYGVHSSCKDTREELTFNASLKYFAPSSPTSLSMSRSLISDIDYLNCMQFVQPRNK